MIIALGITWVLDGVEVGLAAPIGDILRRHDTLQLTASWVGGSAFIYLLGEVVGALYFGRLADRLGRRKLFIITLGLYLVANGLTALSFNKFYFVATRFVAGMGIGGEYAAIHSAIDELTPAKYRGRVDIAVAGTYWAGAMLAACAQILLLDPNLVPVNLGWRFGLLIGPLIGIAIWPLRKYIPESPRWQIAHGQATEAEVTVTAIEDSIRKKGIELPEVDPSRAVVVHQKEAIGYLTLLRVMSQQYRKRFVLSLSLMITQSFLYNAIFFTYALILKDFYGVTHIGYYFFPFALGNLIGPLALGRLFDTVGRRKMISITYCTSGLLLALSGALFARGALDATTQTALWCVIFFIASAAASSAYLTVSEVFPVEIRAQAISVVFAIAAGIGGIGPFVFGAIIDRATDPVTHKVISVGPLAIAYVVSAAIMVAGGVVAWFYGIDAEGKSLEDIAEPVREAAA
ncbi:MFS transporter [soil metagenome]